MQLVQKSDFRFQGVQLHRLPADAVLSVHTRVCLFCSEWIIVYEVCKSKLPINRFCVKIPLGIRLTGKSKQLRLGRYWCISAVSFTRNVPLAVPFIRRYVTCGSEKTK